MLGFDPHCSLLFSSSVKRKSHSVGHLITHLAFKTVVWTDALGPRSTGTKPPAEGHMTQSQAFCTDPSILMCPFLQWKNRVASEGGHCLGGSLDCRSTPYLLSSQCRLHDLVVLQFKFPTTTTISQLPAKSMHKFTIISLPKISIFWREVCWFFLK